MSAVIGYCDYTSKIMFLDAQLLKFDKNMLPLAEKLFQDILVSLAKNYNFGASQLKIMPQKVKKKTVFKKSFKN